MKNKSIKIVKIVIICLCCLIVFSPKVEASNNINQWIETGNNFINNGSKGENGLNTNAMRDAVMPIAQALVAIATVVLLVVTVVMGIKYMLTGSPEEKAKLKTQLIGLVVSIIVIFGAQIIWAAIYNFMINLT